MSLSFKENGLYHAVPADPKLLRPLEERLPTLRAHRLECSAHGKYKISSIQQMWTTKRSRCWSLVPLSLPVHQNCKPKLRVLLLLLEKVTLSVQDHVNFLSGEMCLPAPQKVHAFRVSLHLEQMEFQAANVSGDWARCLAFCFCKWDFLQKKLLLWLSMLLLLQYETSNDTLLEAKLWN